MRLYGKPREILAGNGSSFGGTNRNSRLDRLCKKQEIRRIHPKVGRPQTIGKVEKLIDTIKKKEPKE